MLMWKLCRHDGPTNALWSFGLWCDQRMKWKFMVQQLRFFVSRTQIVALNRPSSAVNQIDIDSESVLFLFETKNVHPPTVDYIVRNVYIFAWYFIISLFSVVKKLPHTNPCGPCTLARQLPTDVVERWIHTSSTSRRFAVIKEIHTTQQNQHKIYSQIQNVKFSSAKMRSIFHAFDKQQRQRSSQPKKKTRRKIIYFCNWHNRYNKALPAAK